MSTTTALRFVADVWTSSVDKHSYEHEIPVQLCNYMDAYRNDQVRPGPDLLRATASREEVSRFRLQVGDTVLTKDSEDPNDIGISAYVAETADDFVCGYHLAIARPRLGTHPRYLTWALRSRPVLDHFSQNANGISRYGLTTSGLLAAPIPMDDLATQVQIADFLDDRVDRIDQIIAARRRQASLADAALLETARTLTTRGRSSVTRPSGIAWMPEIGAQHALWRIGQAFTTGSGTTPRSDKVDYYDGEIPWATTSDLRDSLAVLPPRTVTSMALADHSALALYPAGTLLVAMYGATVGRAGILAVGATVNQACCALQSREIISPKYAFYWLLAHRSEIMTLASGGGQPNISQDVVRGLRIPAPPWDEQFELAAALDESAEQADLARASLTGSVELLDEYKQSLITAAVTGEIDVTTAGSGIPG